ncbi:hypothetical protein [Changchengzhania lutea]|uniref:hypothetical protein n=1 Tax=Changchengzhania lutea TaxID=2049305 RepID=UPI00115D4523|nr:hypothetical protein [Changchengzhania lutea]
MTLSIVIVICLLLIIALLLVPVIICIDTVSKQYYIQLQGIVKANLEGHDTEVFRIKLNVLLMKFYIYPLKKKRLSKRGKSKKNDVDKNKRHLPFIRVLKMLKTFKVKDFFINIDTGDLILNAKLYPVFALLNYNGGKYHINFQGQNQLVLLIKNRPIYIIKSFINF